MAIQISNLQDYSSRILANRADLNKDQQLSSEELSAFYRQSQSNITEADINSEFMMLESQSSREAVLSNVVRNAFMDFGRTAWFAFGNLWAKAHQEHPLNISNLEENSRKWSIALNLSLAMATMFPPWLREFSQNTYSRYDYTPYTSNSLKDADLALGILENALGSFIGLRVGSQCVNFKYMIISGLISVGCCFIFRQASLYAIDKAF